MSSSVAPTTARSESQDPVVRLASRVIGGPRGRYAADLPEARNLRLTAALLALGSCLTLVLGLLQKSYCLRFGWGAPDVYWKACYSDLPSYAAAAGLRGGLPYGGDGPLSEPLGVGVALRLLAAFVPQDGFARQQGFFVGWAVMAALLLVATTVATVWTCRRDPVRAAHVALSPLIVTVALVSTDLLGVALASVALLLWSRDRPTAAGVVMGLAIVSRTYPLVLLVALGVLALRAGVLGRWARTAGVALVTAVLALAAASVVSGTGTLTAYQAWMRASAQLGSPWYLATLWEKPIALGVLTLLAVLGWLLAFGSGALLSLGATVRPRIGEVAIVMVVLVLVTGKSLPVQSSIWLLPLVALAGLRWRDHLVWAATEVCYFVAVWLYLGGLDHEVAALPKTWFAAFLVLRLLGLAWLAVAATRQALARGVSAPATAGEVDDAAGPMTGRSDAVVVRYER